MGLCATQVLTEEQKAAIADSVKLDQKLGVHKESDGSIIKLLLLGTGESGKSTIFRQMQILYEEGFSDFEKSTFRTVIRRNVIEAMQTLIHGAERLEYPFASHAANEAAVMITKLDAMSLTSTADGTVWGPDIVNAIKMLWADKGLRTTFDNRSKLQLLDSAEYLFENITRIGKTDFVPTSEDILRARLRTSGIVERMFKIQKVDFKFIDVGGQRNERRKWIHCFDAVTAIIFVTAISEYDQVLYEDEKHNRLTESVEVFETVCNNKCFAKTTIILFLNKSDLFAEKIKRVPLGRWLSDYKGDNSFADACKHIEEKFLAVNQTRKMIYPHVTCATDTTNVEKVFEACRVTILQKNLDELGVAVA